MLRDGCNALFSKGVRGDEDACLSVPSDSFRRFSITFIGFSQARPSQGQRCLRSK